MASRHKGKKVAFGGVVREGHAWTMGLGSGVVQRVGPHQLRKSASAEIREFKRRQSGKTRKERERERVTQAFAEHQLLCEAEERRVAGEEAEGGGYLPMDVDHAATFEMSHAGGEMAAGQEAIADMAAFLEDVRTVEGLEAIGKRRRDRRTRADRTHRRNMAFLAALVNMANAYSWFTAKRTSRRGAWEPADLRETEGSIVVRIFDVFEFATHTIPLTTDYAEVAACLVAQGLFPSAPVRPSIVFTIDVLELFRVHNLNCPRLSIQSFVRAQCELYAIPFNRNLGKQFSIALDQYHAVRRRLQTRVLQICGRDSEHWRLKHVCPACTYVLKDEAELTYSMLVTMDGNNSLKRNKNMSRALIDEGTGVMIEGENRELQDERHIMTDFVLTPEEVNEWAKPNDHGVAGNPDASQSKEENVIPSCPDRWKILGLQTKRNNTLTGPNSPFDETGWFLSLCRHAFPLVGCDMIRSGELSKYPLACLERLLKTFGPKMLLGYDIGCGLEPIFKRSGLLELVRGKRLTCCVGAFLGHAHNRTCQLIFLISYLLGAGMEDLETAERVFMGSNALAASTRHASKFHRIQAIVNYFEHQTDFHAYASLSDLLHRKYTHALEAIATVPAQLDAVLKVIPDSTITDVERWPQEELAYLQALTKEPAEDAWEMDYMSKLLQFEDLRREMARFEAECAEERETDTSGLTTALEREMQHGARSIAAKRRHQREKKARMQEAIHQLEAEGVEAGRLNLPWHRGDDAWRDATIKLDRRHYRRCLDSLERLVLSRQQELEKANMAGTGYKMRRFISKAVQTRSKAVHGALRRYNAAAKQLNRPELEWDEVVDYGFIAEFDLLRGDRTELLKRPWASPKGREAITLHQKLLRAREEIKRLDVEVARFATHIHDEDIYLRRMEERALDPFDVHIREYRMVRGRVDAYHRRRLLAITKLPGSTASVAIGEAVHSHFDDDPQCGALDTDETMTAEASMDGGGLTETEPATLTYPDGDEDDADSDLEGGTEEERERDVLQLDKILEVASTELATVDLNAEEPPEPFM